MKPVAIVGAGALSAYGLGWKGMGKKVVAGALLAAPLAESGRSHPGIISAEVGALPEARSPAEKRARGLMSRSALLAALAGRSVMEEAGWAGHAGDLGYFLGVGASCGDFAVIEAIVRASVEPDPGGQPVFSTPRFGERGLRACNPLFAFQLMNNFTLCHSAIQEGTTGPNAAFFSRGTGTVMALGEAVCALAEGTCTRALAGGADSAVYPMTLSEIMRQGWLQRGLIPAEGAGILALSADETGALGFVHDWAIQSCRGRSRALAMTALLARLGPHVAAADLVVLVPWGPPCHEELLLGHERLRRSGARVVDLSASLGHALAAAPALGWIAALDMVAHEGAEHALIISAGLDGDLGAVVMGRRGSA